MIKKIIPLLLCFNIFAAIPVGAWKIHYSWGCTGDFFTDDITLFNNNTFYVPHFGHTGFYSYNEESKFYSHFFNHANIIYSGYFDEVDTVEGTMTSQETMEFGCFSMVKNPPTDIF